MSTHTAQYEGIEIEYELIRKDVKYINLRVNKKGQVVVSAPQKAPLSVVEDFVSSKALWVITHLAEIEQIRQSIPPAGLYNGKLMYYLGKVYTLTIFRGAPSISFDGDSIRMTSMKENEEALEEEYLSWLRGEAKQKFEEVMTRIFPLINGIERPSISVRNMRSIWGSCTVGGNSIRLNLRLMKYPEACIEMVILHELLHFRYPNHDKVFYDTLTDVMPDWEERKAMLEEKNIEG